MDITPSPHTLDERLAAIAVSLHGLADGALLTAIITHILRFVLRVGGTLSRRRAAELASALAAAAISDAFYSDWELPGDGWNHGLGAARFGGPKPAPAGRRQSVAESVAGPVADPCPAACVGRVPRRSGRDGMREAAPGCLRGVGPPRRRTASKRLRRCRDTHAEFVTIC